MSNIQFLKPNAAGQFVKSGKASDETLRLTVYRGEEAMPADQAVSLLKSHDGGANVYRAMASLIVAFSADVQATLRTMPQDDPEVLRKRSSELIRGELTRLGIPFGKETKAHRTNSQYVSKIAAFVAVSSNVKDDEGEFIPTFVANKEGKLPPQAALLIKTIKSKDEAIATACAKVLSALKALNDMAVEAGDLGKHLLAEIGTQDEPLSGETMAEYLQAMADAVSDE